MVTEAEEVSILKLSMQTLKEHYGLNPGKYAKPSRGLGYQLGEELSRSFHSRDYKSLISELAVFWKRNQLGELTWESEEEGLISVSFCSDCIGRSYGAGYVLCPFKEGLIEAVLNTRLTQKYSVTELECCGTSAPGCLFQITSTDH